MDKISIPDLKELKPSYTKDKKSMFKVNNINDFYIENNSLLYLDDGKINRIRCVINYENKYKSFCIKPSDICGYTIYFFFDVEKQGLYITHGQYEIKNKLTEWSKYLANGGTYEKAIEHNSKCFDIFDGI